MPDLDDDATLATLHAATPAALRCEPDALEQVYDLTADLLASVAFGLLHDRHAAEDVVQEAFLRLIRAAPGIREADGRVLRAWLVRTTRNLCIDRLRAAPTRREEPTLVLPEVDPAAAADAALDEVEPALSVALAQLTPDQREAIVLFHVAGLSGHEVAETLGRNRAAVYTLLRRAERQLRKHLTTPSDVTAPIRPHGG